MGRGGLGIWSDSLSQRRLKENERAVNGTALDRARKEMRAAMVVGSELLTGELQAIPSKESFAARNE